MRCQCVELKVERKGFYCGDSQLHTDMVFISDSGHRGALAFPPIFSLRLQTFFLLVKLGI